MNAGLSVKPTMEEVWTLDSSEDDSSEDDLTKLNINNIKYKTSYVFEMSDFPFRCMYLEGFYEENIIAFESQDSDAEYIKSEIQKTSHFFEMNFTKIENTNIYVSNFCSAYDFFTNNVKKVGDAYYSKDGKRFIRYIGNEENYDILEETTTIGFGAFLKNNNLKNVGFPGGLKSIETVAFADCKNIREISIPSNVVKINAMAFYRCSNLNNVLIQDNSNIEHVGLGTFAETPWFDN